MAFDPIQEDCHRLVLESMRRNHIPLSDSSFVQSCMVVFEENPDDLVKTDRDRAFHLVAKTAESVDYRIPFITDDLRAEEEATRAEVMINEAVQLDPQNWDAVRMQGALGSETNDAYVNFMLERVDEVQAAMLEACSSTATSYDREFSADLGRRPYTRWLNALASRLLISGRYRKALDFAEQSLAFDPTDPGDARYTALFAAAKLEYSPEELKRFRARHQLAFRAAAAPRRWRHNKGENLDAWSLIAEMCSHYRAFNYEAADAALSTLMRTYPHAADACYFQAEFPDGVYARVNVNPGSTDELVLALSEATPLLQEGLGTPDAADFAIWLQDHELVRNGIDKQMVQNIEAARNKRWGEA